MVSYLEPAVVCFTGPQYLCCYREHRRCLFPKYGERFKLSVVSVGMVTGSACTWTLKVAKRVGEGQCKDFPACFVTKCL